MADALRLYLRYLGISIRGQMQYRTSFLMLAAGTFVVNLGEFVCTWALFDRFGAVRGWRLAEVAMLYGMVNVAFAISDAFSRGFDTFDRLIRGGGFDRLLLRPRATALQVAGQELTLFRVGRLSVGLVILLWAAWACGVHWTAWRLAVLAETIAGGACLFAGLWVLQATLSFWSTESLEIVNVFTYGGVATTEFPLSIYSGWLRSFFTFVVPLACVTYLPALAILGRDDPAFGSPLWLQCATPLVGPAFLAVALRFWRFGERHYRSTGS